MLCGNFCGKLGNDRLACLQCKTLYCSARCQSKAAAYHPSICAEMVQANAEIGADLHQAKKVADASANSLIKELDKEGEEKKSKAGAKKKKTKAKEPLQVQAGLQSEEYCTKPFSSRQAHEAHIYSILAKKIDKYRNFCHELPEKAGLRLMKLDQHLPQGPEQIERSYIKLVELLREIHAAGVVCSNLNPQHVLARKDGEIFIAGFDCSHCADGNDSNQDASLSLSWASVDQLTNQKCDVVDDLEAACRIAKHWATPSTEEFKHQSDSKFLYLSICGLTVANLCLLLPF